MNLKKSLSLAIIAGAVCTAGNVAYAADAVKVYGKLRGFVENYNGDAVHDDVWEVSSGNSRFGVKGGMAVSDGLEAFYKLEWQVDIADDKTNSGDAGEDDPEHFKSRNQVIGLKSKWGSVMLGRNDTPMKKLKSYVVLFDDTAGHSSNMMAARTRANNIIQLGSDFGVEGLDVKVMGIPGEEQDVTGCLPCDDRRNSIADGISSSITWSNDTFTIGAGNDNEVKSGSSGLLGKKLVDATRVVAQVKLDEFVFGAHHQKAEDTTAGVNQPDEETSKMFSAKMKQGKYTLKLQAGETELEDGASGQVVEERKQLAFGVDRKLSDKVTVMTLVNKYTDDDGIAEVDERAIAAGLQIVF